MRDDLLQPAFAIYNSPGVYALLLGSGVSRSAEIMTGWDIMRDLIKQIGIALHEEIEGTPEEWYAKRFGKEAGYDLLLEHLGQTPLDRNAILKDYIEPSEADREEDRKVPTPAHKAIAWLVEKGYIRVILTTNFDRLIETALQEKGIVPNVVSTDADIDTMRPLQHSPITIIKIHGDYRDEITKNTKPELADYSDKMKSVLQRVFSEYGLIVSGWSADWDTALKELIENSKSKFAMYWSWFGKQQDSTRQLFVGRNAYEIPEIKADVFFSELQKMVEALEGTNQKPSLSVAIAVERTKKMLPRPEFHIDLEELFVNETVRTYQMITSNEFDQKREEIQKQAPFNYQGLWQLHYDVAEIPLNIAATLCFYGEGTLSDRIHTTLTTWAIQPKNPHLVFRLFPSLLLMYSAGISAVFRRNWNDLATLLTDNELESPYIGKPEPFLIVAARQIANSFSKGQLERKYAGDYLYPLLRSVFQNYITSDTEYQNTFDLFEMLMTIMQIKMSERSNWILPHTAMFEQRSWDYLRRFWHAGGNMENWDLLISQLWQGDAKNLGDTLTNYVSLASQQNVVWGIPNYAAIYKGDSVSH